jgi:hypothetical protein
MLTLNAFDNHRTVYLPEQCSIASVCAKPYILAKTLKACYYKDHLHLTLLGETNTPATVTEGTLDILLLKIADSN